MPASVYIPFVGDSIRNNCVLHIPPNEARVFQTKERCPILLCIEVYRPDEISLVLEEKLNLRKINALRKNKKVSGKARSHTELSMSEEDSF